MFKFHKINPYLGINIINLKYNFYKHLKSE